MFNPNQPPQIEETLENAAQLLGLSSDATAEEVIARYDAMAESDKRTSEWEAERDTREEMELPIWVDRLVEDLRSQVQNAATEGSSEKLPSMAAIAEALQNLGFNVTENDANIMREAVQELIDGKDDGIHTLPVGTEKALGM